MQARSTDTPKNTILLCHSRALAGMNEREVLSQATRDANVEMYWLETVSAPLTFQLWQHEVRTIRQHYKRIQCDI